MNNDEWIEEKIAEYEQEHYAGAMPSHNKQTMRLVLQKQLEAEERLDQLSLRDYVYGQDDGEARA